MWILSHISAASWPQDAQTCSKLTACNRTSSNMDGREQPFDKNLMKTMNKEEDNNFVIPMLAWILQFFPDIFLTPQQNLLKDGERDRLIFNAAV